MSLCKSLVYTASDQDNLEITGCIILARISGRYLKEV